MSNSHYTPPKNPVRAVFFSAGSSLANLGERLMERFSDPASRPPPPEPILPPAPVKEPSTDEDIGFHLELELVCDPEISSADPSETIVHQIVLNITTWRSRSEAITPRAHTRLEAYSDKLIHLNPYTISIEKGRMASMDGLVPVAQKE